MPARKPRPSEKPQSDRFIETAREIGADETPEAFERVFEQIAKPRGGITPADSHPHRNAKRPAS